MHFSASRLASKKYFTLSGMTEQPKVMAYGFQGWARNIVGVSKYR